jgi:hypothetical protein
MKIIKFFLLSLLFIYPVKAATIVNNDKNQIDINGNLNIAYFNKLPSENTYDFITNNNYYSGLGISASNKTLANITTTAVFSIQINNKYYYPQEIDKTYYKALEVDELYLEFAGNEDSVKMGNFNSQVIANTLGATNYAGIFLLDAGFSFTGSSAGLFGEPRESDFSTEDVYQGLGHYYQAGSVKVAVELESPRDNLNPRNSFEVNAFDRVYTAAVSLSYAGDTLGLSIGYKRMQNKLAQEFRDVFSRNMINSDNVFASTYLNLGNLYIATSGGYYKNLKIAGINHTGASALVSYQLTKIKPYVGYQILYADNLHKNGGAYGLVNGVNYSFDQSAAVVGVSYNVFDGLSMGIEHMNDIRTKSQRRTSLLNNVNNDITAIYLQYSF